MPDSFPMAIAPPDVAVLRHQEFQQLRAMFETHRSPRLVLLIGDVAMGKTSLLDQALISARVEGWQVLPGDAPELRVDLSTTVRSFTRRLSELIGLDIIGDLSSAEGTGDVDSFTAQTERVMEWLTAARGPITLALSDYRPGRAFREWFEQTFVPRVLAGERPVLLVVEGSKTGLAGLHGSAHLAINLDVAPSEPIRKHFERIAPLLSPSLSPEELHVYVEECRRKPALMEGLTRMLLLVASPSVTTSLASE